MNKIHVDKKRLAELKKKQPSGNWKKELKDKLNYYNENPFPTREIIITLPSNKERVVLTNPDGELIKESHTLPTEEEFNRDKENNDLKTFLFNENEIIQKRIFPSLVLKKGKENIFGFGILLPRNEDIKNKNNEIIGTKQVWRPVIITSNRRGLVISEWFRKEYKIDFEAIPFDMKLRWSLSDIKDFTNSKYVDKIDGYDLFKKIKQEYEHYLYFRNDIWYSVNALWDLGTYLHQLFSAFPLKEERGLAGSAKSKTMVVSSYITLNATEIMTNPSESTLFRLTEEIRPTKYIDEAEKLFKFTKEGMEADNRVELINASYTRNGVVPRQEKIGNSYTTKWYHVYSPTRIASINGLYGATESRAITQIHSKNPDKDNRGERDPEDDFEHKKWKDIRNLCYRWALTNWQEVHNAYHVFVNETKLKKRDFQIWKPLLVIASVLDKDTLFKEIVEFAEKLSEQRKDDILSEGTLDYKYLNCINKLFGQISSNKIYIDDIRLKFKIIYPHDDLPKSNKSISSRIDKLGFKELRGRDNQKSYYEINKSIFDEIISPITNDFSTQSPQSPLSKVNSNKKSGKEVVKSVEYKNKDNKKSGEYGEDGDCGERLDKDVEKAEEYNG